MDTPIIHADAFGHVRAIMGMVLGLSVARLVNGLTRFIQHPGNIRIYPIHFGWVLFVLMAIIHFWWYEFYLSQIIEWTFPIYLFLIIYTMLFAMISALLFPDRMDDYSGFEDYFESRKRWFYMLLALIFILDLGDSWIKGEEYFRSLGSEYLVRGAAFTGCSIVAAFVSGRKFPIAFLVLGSIYQISWILRLYDILG